jgi:hypothetical protein
MRDRRSKDARSITIRDLLEKKGGEARKGSASLLSLGASRAAGSWIGQSRARSKLERDRMGKRAGTYNVWMYGAKGSLLAPLQVPV